MRWLLIFLVILVIGGVGVYGAGSALPEEMVTIRGAQYKAPVAKLWKLVTNYQDMKRWNDGIEAVTAIPEVGTKETLWDVQDAEGRHMVLKVIVSEENKMHLVKIIKNDLPFTGSWRFEFTENNNGTWLKMEEHSRISNPFLRFFTYYVLGNDYGVQAYLMALARYLVQDIQIKELAA